MSELMKPFTTLINWSMTYEIQIGGVSFTFFEMWIYIFIAGIITGFIKWMRG